MGARDHSWAHMGLSGRPRTLTGVPFGVLVDMPVDVCGHALDAYGRSWACSWLFMSARERRRAFVGAHGRPRAHLRTPTSTPKISQTTFLQQHRAETILQQLQVRA